MIHPKTKPKKIIYEDKQDFEQSDFSNLDISEGIEDSLSKKFLSLN